MLFEHESGETDQRIRRAIACWNACEGIPTEVLENVQLLAVMDDVWGSLNSLQKYLDMEHCSGLVHGANAFTVLCDFTREVPYANIVQSKGKAKNERPNNP